MDSSVAGSGDSQATTSSLEISGSGQITHSSKPFFPVPSPVLVYPDGRRQKPSVPTRKSAQGPGWTCLPEVRDPVSKSSVHVEERHRQPYHSLSLESAVIQPASTPA